MYIIIYTYLTNSLRCMEENRVVDICRASRVEEEKLRILVEREKQFFGVIFETFKVNILVVHTV